MLLQLYYRCVASSSKVANDQKRILCAKHKISIIYIVLAAIIYIVLGCFVTWSHIDSLDKRNSSIRS